MQNPKRPQLSPLFDLERSLRSTRPQPPKPKSVPPAQKLPSEASPNQWVTARSFDWDEAIELEYRQEAFPDTSQVSSPFSKQHSFSAEPENDSQSFEVEEFEPYEVQSAQVDSKAFALEDEDEDRADSTDRSIPTQPEVKAYRQSDWKKTSETKQVEVDVTAPFSARPLKTAQPIEQSDSAEDADRDQGFADAFAAEAFAADIEAILTGKIEVLAQPAEVPIALSTLPSAPSHPHDVFDQIAQDKLLHLTPTPSPEPPAQEESSPFAYSHAIFDQMAEGMAYANSFNLGTISLKQQFDEFDRLIDQQEQQHHLTSELALSHAADLNEKELAEDLALINGIEFANQMGQLPTKGKPGKGSSGEKKKQPQKNPPSKNPAKLPYQYDDPARLFYLIWNNSEAKTLLCQYASSYPALLGDLALLIAIEAKDYDKARNLLINPPDLCTINCIAFDDMRPQDIEDDYLNHSIVTIIDGFISDHFKEGKFYSSPQAQQIAEILAQAQQMAVPAIDTTMSANYSAELESEIVQAYSREEKDLKSIDRPEMATALTYLFVVASDKQQQIIQALEKNSLTVALINPELIREQKTSLEAPIKITRSSAPYDNCWDITDTNNLSYNIRITTDDNSKKTVEVHDTTPEVEYAIAFLKSLENEFKSLRYQVASDRKFPLVLFTEVNQMLGKLEKKLKEERPSLEELIDLATEATGLKVRVAIYRPKQTDQARREIFLKNFDDQLKSAVDKELWQRGKNYGGTVQILVPKECWQIIKSKYHNQSIEKQKQRWGGKLEETIKYYVTERSKSIVGFDISGHIWNTKGDTLETVFVLHIYWES